MNAESAASMSSNSGKWPRPSVSILSVSSGGSTTKESLENSRRSHDSELWHVFKIPTLEKTRRQIHDAVRKCEWPIGTGLFTIYPQSGKKRGEGNGVKPIKNEFMALLKSKGWAIEGGAKNALDQKLGDFDAVLPGPERPIVAEWETGNISSSHRSMKS